MISVIKLQMFKIFFLSFQPKPGSSSSSSQAAPDSVSKGSQQPQTLEELLERQWEQGSQFLMEQASHFDSKFILVFLTKTRGPCH